MNIKEFTQERNHLAVTSVTSVLTGMDFLNNISKCTQDSNM